MLKNKVLRLAVLITSLVLLIAAVAGCSSPATSDNNEGQKAKEPIVFAGLNWASAQFNNEVARYIIEHGYGYETDAVPGETIPLFAGLAKGDVDVNMECWVENQQEAYDKYAGTGDVIDLGTNFDDNVQGIFVPTYVIEGDPERGIEPMAPDLRTIDDLPKYWKLFKDPEDPTKGRFYGGVPGWEADKILTKKMSTYGLDETYNLFRPGSGAALDSSLVSAYEKGEPWVGYYWAPTWIFGKLDLTQIEEPDYSEELWNNGYGCDFPSVHVNICVHKEFPEKYPEITEFLKKYGISSDIISEALAYMRDNNVKEKDAALWFLREKEDIWTQWVPEDVAQKVKDSLNS
ncbi:MAG: ABC transporter substrate-binding protein [Peptococcaceae bacterium]|nr:ABC transporter substrate-binding protein [Peptococcaceae bacterium]